MTLFSILQPLALIAVLIALGLGLFNMMRAGPANKSQMFMRWRVGLQFIAILVLVVGLYFTGR